MFEKILSLTVSSLPSEQTPESVADTQQHLDQSCTFQIKISASLQQDPKLAQQHFTTPTQCIPFYFPWQIITTALRCWHI